MNKQISKNDVDINNLKHGFFSTCGWIMKDRSKCGGGAKYELGYPDEEDKIPICALHASRCSTLGWPVTQRRAM